MTSQELIWLVLAAAAALLVLFVVGPWLQRLEADRRNAAVHDLIRRYSAAELHAQRAILVAKLHDTQGKTRVSAIAQELSVLDQAIATKEAITSRSTPP